MELKELEKLAGREMRDGITHRAASKNKRWEGFEQSLLSVLLRKRQKGQEMSPWWVKHILMRQKWQKKDENLSWK